jgi:hypothetical protein
VSYNNEANVTIVKIAKPRVTIANFSAEQVVTMVGRSSSLPRSGGAARHSASGGRGVAARLRLVMSGAWDGEVDDIRRHSDLGSRVAMAADLPLP